MVTVGVVAVTETEVVREVSAKAEVGKNKAAKRARGTRLVLFIYM
jgi:hypothetical protein